jgi:hypothetical protein
MPHDPLDLPDRDPNPPTGNPAVTDTQIDDWLAEHGDEMQIVTRHRAGYADYQVVVWRGRELIQIDVLFDIIRWALTNKPDAELSMAVTTAVLAIRERVEKLIEEGVA